MAAKTTLPSTKSLVPANIPPKQPNRGRFLYCKEVVCVIGGGVLGAVATTAMLLYVLWLQNRSSISSCGASINYPCVLFPASMVGLFVGLPLGGMGGDRIANRLR
ncbi:MAG TPA: hypothetical protein VLG44_04775 [Chlamydiales bacterium]|nr:hypothetical protein [Chlamydiales bacterium]